jgi:uncharacterized protein (TIGR02217 family)
MFIETPRFPECVSLGGVGGREFFTQVVQAESGHEIRNRVREIALGRWEVGHNVMGPEDYEPMREMFYNAGGRWSGFRYRDHTDYAVTAAQGKFEILTATTAQLLKRYTWGAYTYDHPIQKPVSTVSFTGGSTLSLDYATGILTYVTIPTAWAGEFDVPARFDVDKLEYETLTRRRTDNALLIGWKSIPIQEIRLPT